MLPKLTFGGLHVDAFCGMGCGTLFVRVRSCCSTHRVSPHTAHHLPQRVRGPCALVLSMQQRLALSPVSRAKTPTEVVRRSVPSVLMMGVCRARSLVIDAVRPLALMICVCRAHRLMVHTVRPPSRGRSRTRPRRGGAALTVGAQSLALIPLAHAGVPDKDRSASQMRDWL